MYQIRLKSGREKPIAKGHPWVFSGAIQSIGGEGAPGEPCVVIGADGRVLGHGYFNPVSSISVRMLTRGNIPFDLAELRRRVETALAARSSLPASNETDSCRLINTEGDFLPGLIVDKYAGGLCVQLLTSGMERLRAPVMDALHALLNPQFVFDRSDTEAREEREGLPPAEGLVHGVVPEKLVITENGLRFGVDIAGGQKTGFYFDQRVNRLLVRGYAGGKHCLDCFTYSGGFAANMLAAGAASVTAVDSSKNALEWCERTIAMNGFPNPLTCIGANVFDFLRETDSRYDCIVLDPPKFAKHPSEIQKAARGYKDINLLAMKKIAPGGILFTFSCSNAVDTRLFRQIVFAAAVDAGRPVQVLHSLSAGPDHPVSITHPEGEYLKGLVMRVV